MNDLDDVTLLERWREHRDGDAFAELARRHSSVVFDITCRVLGDRCQAEDVLQEALLDLALERTGKPADVGVVAWLVRFAICRARNRRSSERCRARRQIVVGLKRPEAAMPDDGFELKEELEHALAGCDPEDRALLAMRFLHGWEYDRIASALSIQEGAARVRVHRALQTVRSRVSASETNRVAPALGALPLAAMSPDALSLSIRTVIELAKVQLGAPANGLEHATAATRSFRVAVTLSGAALLFVAAAGATVVPGFRGDTPASGAEFAEAVPATTLPRASLLDGLALQPAPIDAAFRGVPRPADWDGGLLRAFRDEGTDAPLPAGDAARPAARATVAGGVPEPAAAAEPVPQFAAGGSLPAGDSPSALRPKVRGACAAKGEPLSSEGEWAGALGGGAPAAGDTADTTDTADSMAETRGDDRTRPDGDPPAAAPARSGPASRGRAAPARVALEALPDDTRVLVGAAEDLLRRLLVAEGADDASADVDAEASAADDVRRQIRQVRKNFGRLRRGLGQHGDVPAPSRAKRPSAMVLRQVLGLLTQVVLTDGRVAGDLRWPAGADVAYALEEVIRVLGAHPDSVATTDSAAGPADAGGRLPAGAAGDTGGAP